MPKKFVHIALFLAVLFAFTAMPAMVPYALGASSSLSPSADTLGLHAFKSVQYAMLGALSFEPGFAAQDAASGMSNLSEAMGMPEHEDWPPRFSRQWWNSRSPVSRSYGLDGRLEVMTVLWRSYQLEKPGLADMREWDGIFSDLRPVGHRAYQQENDATIRVGRLSAKLLAARNADSPQDVLRSLSSASINSDPTLWDEDPASSQSSGYMALQMGKGPLGVTIGGGYSRTELAATGGDDPPAQRGGMSLSSLSTAGAQNPATGSPYASVGRWSAFLAVPYQITDNLGLSPEFSYYHGDSPQYSDDAGNEWIMGFQIRFGF